MPRFWHSRPWRFGRVCFRWLRMLCWLLLLTLICSLVYLNQVGLPDFLKRRLIEELHSRGIEFEYSEIRLDFYGGIVAERVQIGSVKDSNAPSLFVESVGLQLNPQRLYRQHQLEVDSLNIQGGRLTLPVNTSNGPATNLVVEGIEGQISLLADDMWQVQELKARSLGARLQFSGTVTNASVLQDWKLAGTGRGQAVWREYLWQTIVAAGNMRFAAIPELKGHVRLDAADPMRAQAHLVLHADGAHTPWGDAEKFALDVIAVPATNHDEILGARIELRMTNAATPWGKAKDLMLRTQTRPLEHPGAWPGGGLNIEALAPDTRWGSAAKLRLDLTLSDVQTNLTEMNGRVELNVQEPKTKWASAASLHITARAAQIPVGNIVATDASWSWWADLTPYELDWQLTTKRLVTEKGELGHLEAHGHWRAPDLAVDDLKAELLGGRLLGSARVNVESRTALAQAAIDFDVKKLDRLLTSGAQHWLSQYSWDQPPIANARGGVKLPPWNSDQPDWHREVLPTLWLNGTVTNQAGAFREVPFDRARLDFQFTNQTWHLRDMVAERPEGQVFLQHDSDERTKDYSFKVRGRIDPKALTPVLDDGGRRVLETFQFTSPPEIKGTIWGRWREPDRIGADAVIHLTNFTFRGERADSFEAVLQYTNRRVTFQNANIKRPEGFATVPAGRFDIENNRLTISNAFSSVEPMSVLRAIGPRTAETMEPYEFLAPPKVWVSGLIHTRDVALMDLKFHVEGGPFRWTRFNLPQVNADLHWVNNGLALTNLDAVFYDGRIRGGAHFDFWPGEGTDFSFTANVWESDLHKLIADVTGRSNKLEGVLNGQLNVTRANSADPLSWQGHGTASLRDGLLWDSPLFGFLSTPLNMIAPGLGNSRASAASATYTITNSVIRTDNLDITANTLRLQYRGTLDFDRKVNARVDVEFLRDTGVLGKLFNLALLPLTKLFEYKVTGTLAEPKTEPLYILPKIILFPLQPVKTIKDLLPGDNKPPATTPPPPSQP